MRKLLFVAVISSAFLYCSCSKRGEVRHTVQYTISGESSMNVSYTNSAGELISIYNVSAQWIYGFTAPGNGRIVKLVVNSTDGTGVGGTIFVDGVETSMNTSSAGSVTITAQIP